MVTNQLYSNTYGVYNTALGSQALYNNDGDENSAVGDVALYANTTGIGKGALGDNFTGNDNTAVGYGSGPGYNTTNLSNNCAWK